MQPDFDGCCGAYSMHYTASVRRVAIGSFVWPGCVNHRQYNLSNEDCGKAGFMLDSDLT